MIDVGLLQSALAKRLPGFETISSCERLTAGASRETYRISAVIDGKPTLLALRRSDGTGENSLGEGPGLVIEAQLFEAASAAGVPGPRIVALLAAEDDLGEGFVMDWIEAETLGGRIARAPQFSGIRPRLARQCGEVLARLHAVDLDTSDLSAVLETASPEACVRQTLATYQALDAPEPMIDFTAQWLLLNLPPERTPALVHGDFRNGNLMVDPERGIVAVLDWELAHIGDPVRDLGWLCTRSWRFGGDAPVGGFGAREDLLEAYESVSGKAVDRNALHFWEVFGSFWWSVGTLSMAGSFRDGGETSLERPMIGRRSSECQIDCVNLLIPGPATAPIQEGGSRSLSGTSLPTSSELLSGVRNFLRDEAPDHLPSREQFLARVGANAIDIALREMEFGHHACDAEERSLRALLSAKDTDRATMRRQLCLELRSGQRDLDDPALHQHLRDTALAQVLIDQPGYPGAQEAMARSQPD